MKTLIEAIKGADNTEIDVSFSILRDFGIGIFRKLKGWALVLDINEEAVIKEAPKDDNGRVIDRTTRHTVCDALVARSKELKEQNNEQN